MRPVWLPLSILCKRNPDHDKTLPEARHRGLPVHPDRLRPAKRNPPDAPEREYAEPEMTQLNQQTIKITQQNALNAKSTRGVYLLPEAKTPARLESQIGTLRMSVGSITPDGDGSRLTLRIQGESNDPLPAFTATVASGQITGTTHSYQEVNVQDQLISAPASTLAPSDVDIPLRLNVTPDKVGFIRVHDIQPAAAQ